ncbi:MAG: hypothetical protein RPR91_10705, partial [Colwellia sp.]
MDTNKAQALLGLTDQPLNHAIVKQAAATKLASLKDKQASAPTEALKQKFASIIAQVNQAAELLLSELSATTSSPPKASESASTSRSALSQTKLADLPGMASADAAQVELQPGTLLASRYQIKELVGQGGMGAVYRAFDKNRDEDIAIKVLLPSLTKNERA